ncbi:hypothetical protein [Rhizobium azibense]|uniref:hypothetical protein n=1 Tax=Rhizobium azibense TaxID=1136135 RepID=UPI00104E28A3|nr:hypothetical protein [Rhizobium azibense]
MLAFLEDKEASLAELAELGWQANLYDLVMLKQRLLERISIKPERQEDLKAWQEILYEELPEERHMAMKSPASRRIGPTRRFPLQRATCFQARSAIHS